MTRHTATEKRHLDFIRSLPCCITGQSLAIEACHIRYSDSHFAKVNPGKGAKPSFIWTVPMIAALHREQHSGNERTFWKRYGFDPDGPVTISPLALALALAGYSHAGDANGAEQFLRQHRDGRRCAA